MDQNLIKVRIIEAIRKKDSGAEVYLFGSRARGDNQPDSDWDILILVDDEKVTLDTEDKFIDELYDLELESGQIITSFIYPKEYWKQYLMYSPLYRNVIREGIRL